MPSRTRSTPARTALRGLMTLALFGISISEVRAQIPSPPATAEVQLGGKQVSIKYSRPSMRSRKVMGGLVPYGQVWRAGANAATELNAATALSIGSLKVPAGTYTLYVLPEEDSWTLIVNKQTKQWGTEYDEGQDLGRVPMKITKLAKSVEQFTIHLDSKNASSAQLVMEWETTSASVSMSAAAK